MRIKLCMTTENDITVPIAYNHIIQRVIYNVLDEKYAKKLHDSGYKYKNKVFKLFNYSKLVIENKIIDRNTLTINPGKVEITISSIDEAFMFKIINAFMDNRELKLREGILKIDSIYSKKQINSEKLRVLTISPVIVTKPKCQNRVEFYNPNDKEFLDSIQKNLLEKYNAFYGAAYNGYLKVVIQDKNKVRKKIDKYKNWIYEGYLGAFEIEGDRNMVELAYSCGIGSKNSQGFGCIETFNDLNNYNNYRRIV